MIKYNNLLSFNKMYTIQLNTIVENQGYIGERSLKDL